MLRTVVIDYETFFTDQEDDRGIQYRLGPQSTESYIRHPWFEAHGAAIKWSPNEPAQWYEERRLRQVLKDEDWSDVFLIHHHAQFDGLILSHHYNVDPRMFGCTLSMARLLLGNHISVSLDSVRKQFGLPVKLTPYSLFKNKHWHELDPNTQRLIGEGACDEVESIWTLFNILGKDFPTEEYEVVDSTVRMFTQPVLRGDIDLLAKIWTDEANSKAARMAELNVTEADLQSAERFAALLRAEGVEPEMKPGKPKANGDEKLIYCFAKTDQFMRDLQEDDNDRVRTLAEARLGAKSTLMQTRAETLGFMASRGPMPVYLRYAGAHTTRDSGGDGANWQNFKRGSEIRKAIMAPEGYLLAPVDLSQVECRILCCLAGQEDYLERFRRGEDVYLPMASKAYGRPVTKADVEMRGTGKQLVLSCGFMAGAFTIMKTAALGIYGPPIKIDLATATQWRDAYREEFYCVPEYWKTAGRNIARIAGGDPLKWGPMLIKDGKIFGPGGTMIHYETLQFHKPAPDEECKEFERDGYWRYRTRNGWTKLYSGKLVENVVQWLARIVMMQAMLRLKALGYRAVMRTHDELVMLIKQDGNEQRHLEICLNEMKRTPTWLPGIPLDAEGSLGERYSK